MNMSTRLMWILLLATAFTANIAHSAESATNTDINESTLKTVSESPPLQKVAIDHTDIDSEPAAPKPVSVRDDEPQMAIIPEQRDSTTPNKRELRFTEIKQSLQGPEGLLHLSKLEKFVGQYPDHTLARLWMIRSQLLAQRKDHALHAIGEPGSWQDTDWQVSFWKAQVYLHHGQLGLAKRAMEYALSNESGSADIWVQQAVLEQESDNHGGAVQLLQIALEVDPSNALARLNLGYSLEHLSQPQAALKAYRQFLSSRNVTNSTLRLDVLKRVELLARYTAQYARDTNTHEHSVSDATQ